MRDCIANINVANKIKRDKTDKGEEENKSNWIIESIARG